MAKVPAFARAFSGRWRIVEVDIWDNDSLDLVEEVHITFQGSSDGEIIFGPLTGFLGVRYPPQVAFFPSKKGRSHRQAVD